MRNATTNYKVIEDNGGSLYLALFADDECTHMLSWDSDPGGALRETLAALESGDDPNLWEGLSADPQREYDEVTAHASGWAVVADDESLYTERMGAAAERELVLKAKKETTMKAETLVTFGDLWDVTGEQHTMGHDLPVCIECPDDYDVDDLEAADIVCDGNIRVLSTDEAIDMWDAED